MVRNSSFVQIVMQIFKIIFNYYLLLVSSASNVGYKRTHACVTFREVFFESNIINLAIIFYVTLKANSWNSKVQLVASKVTLTAAWDKIGKKTPLVVPWSQLAIATSVTHFDLHSEGSSKLDLDKIWIRDSKFSLKKGYKPTSYPLDHKPNH